MSIRKIIAVGMVAVFGVVGMVSAQVIADSENELASRTDVSQSMTVTYEVSSIARLTVTPFTISKANLVANDPEDITDWDGVLAVIQVVCTYDNWDVGVTFANSGKLTDPTTASGGFGGGGARALKNDEKDEIVLKAAVVLLDGSSNTAIASSCVAIKPAGNKSERSFAALLGGALSGDIDGRDVDDVESDGFGPTSNETIGLRFALKVGMHYDGEADGERVTGNPDGTYSETVTVTLYAAY